MTDSGPPPYPSDPANYQFYDDPAIRNPATAPKLLRLAAIFNYVIAGLDAVWGIFLFIIAFFFPAFIHAEMERQGNAAGLPPNAVLTALYAGMAVICIAGAIVKFIAANKLLRTRPGAWGWALAASIIGVPQVFWCSFFCFIPLAVSIFTFVVILRQDVRNYLRAANATPNPPAV